MQRGKQNLKRIGHLFFIFFNLVLLKILVTKLFKLWLERLRQHPVYKSLTLFNKINPIVAFKKKYYHNHLTNYRDWRIIKKRTIEIDDCWLLGWKKRCLIINYAVAERLNCANSWFGRTHSWILISTAQFLLYIVAMKLKRRKKD